MGLTSNCDIFASLHEGIFNRVVANVARQRPSLFNYGTSSFVAKPSLMCHAIEVAPQLPASQPRVALQDPIPVPGTDGAWSMEYCAQLTRLELDFHPGQLTLPSELGPPLKPQSLALHLEVCGGIACPDPRVLTAIGVKEAAKYPPLDPQPGDERPKEPPPREPGQTLPVDPKRVHCFCLELFATAILQQDTTSSGPVIGFELTGLEIVDIKPEGLENSLECLLSATISLGVLPRLRLAVEDIVLSLGDYGSLTLGLTPTSSGVPFNPSIAKDTLSVFVDVTI